LNGKTFGHRYLFETLQDESSRFGGLPVHTQEPVGQTIRFLTRREAGYDALCRAPEIS